MVNFKYFSRLESPDSGELRIVRINQFYGSVIGGDEIYLLCEKVNKKEIRIRFFEIDNDGNQQWEAFGQFNETDVHHQVAIVFRTPPYRNSEIKKPVHVYLQLFRQRDGESSEPRTFIYKPQSNESIVNNSIDFLDHDLIKQIKMENQSGKRRKYSLNNNQQQPNKNRKQQNKNLNDKQQVIKVKKEELDSNDQENFNDNQNMTMSTDNYTIHHHQLPLQQQQQQQQQQLPPIINHNIDHYTTINHQCG